MKFSLSRNADLDIPGHSHSPRPSLQRPETSPRGERPTAIPRHGPRRTDRPGGQPVQSIIEGRGQEGGDR